VCQPLAKKMQEMNVARRNCIGRCSAGLKNSKQAGRRPKASIGEGVDGGMVIGVYFQHTPSLVPSACFQVQVSITQSASSHETIWQSNSSCMAVWPSQRLAYGLP
jgi:hypothetical protein